jgi:hypothetical protein
MKVCCLRRSTASATRLYGAVLSTRSTQVRLYGVWPSAKSTRAQSCIRIGFVTCPCWAVFEIQRLPRVSEGERENTVTPLQTRARLYCGERWTRINRRAFSACARARHGLFKHRGTRPEGVSTLTHPRLHASTRLVYSYVVAARTDS